MIKTMVFWLLCVLEKVLFVVCVLVLAPTSFTLVVAYHPLSWGLAFSYLVCYMFYSCFKTICCDCPDLYNDDRFIQPKSHKSNWFERTFVDGCRLFKKFDCMTSILIQFNLEICTCDHKYFITRAIVDKIFNCRCVYYIFRKKSTVIEGKNTQSISKEPTPTINSDGHYLITINSQPFGLGNEGSEELFVCVQKLENVSEIPAEHVSNNSFNLTIDNISRV